MANDSGQSEKSSSELSDSDGEKDKRRDGSRSPAQRKHKKSKHSKKKSKKKSSKRKKHRDRSRSRSKERHSEKTKKFRDGSPIEKDHVDVKSGAKQHTDELTNQEVPMVASANQEVAYVASTNQNGVQGDELTNQEVASYASTNQGGVPDTLAIKDEPRSPGTERECEASIGENGPNKVASSFLGKSEIVEDNFSLNKNSQEMENGSLEIYDPGLYIANIKEEYDSEQTAKENESAKDKRSKPKSRSISREVSGAIKTSKSREKSGSEDRTSSSKRRRSRSKGRRSSSKGRRSRSKDKRSRSKDKRSRSKDKRTKERSRSKERRSRSKEKQSRSKERRSKGKRSRSGSKERRSKSQEKSGSRSRKRSRDRSAEKSKQRSKGISGEKSTEQSRKRSRSTEKSKEKSKEISKERTESRKRSKDRSRSEKRSKSRGRSEEKSKQRDDKRSTSKERSKRSKSRDRSKDKQSPDRKYRRSRERSHSRQKSSGRSKSRERQRSKSRERRRSRSLERRRFVPRYQNSSRFIQSTDRWRRSRSKSVGRRRHSRSSERRRRSRSRSINRGYQSRSRNRYRSRSPQKYDRSSDRKRRSKSKSEDAGAASVPVNLTIALSVPTTSVTTTTANAKPSKSIADFTALCKKLTESKEDKKNEVGENTVEDEKVSQVYHPFSVKPAKEIVIPRVILPVPKPVEPARPLEQAFPVSSGNQHKTKENTNESVVEGVDGSVAAAEKVFQSAIQQEKLDVSGLIVKRMEAQNRLLSNPHDYEARLVLEEIQMKIQNWASVNLKPGQYTGESLISSLTPKENINSGYQAWARKDMFLNLAPIRGGVGMRLLQKMGWRPGQVIGKRGEGSYEPIALNVKTDRKGLVSFAEAGAKGKGGGKGGGKNIMAAQAVQGKHPVSALAELCTKRRWKTPTYNVSHESGPSHKKDFLYQVIVNGNSYQHNIASNNKKLAKAEAAFAALKALGVVPADAAMAL